MEEHNLYQNIGCHSQEARNEQTRYSDSKMYMVPKAAQLYEENEYEELQISTAPSKKN